MCKRDNLTTPKKGIDLYNKWVHQHNTQDFDYPLDVECITKSFWDCTGFPCAYRQKMLNDNFNISVDNHP